MGDASHVEYCNIQILDVIGLKTYIEMVENNKLDPSETERYNACSDTLRAVKKGIGEVKEDNTGSLNLDGLDGFKIISYYYHDLIQIFQDIAPFIEGYVEFGFVTRNEAANVIWENGICRIEVGEMEWETTPINKISRNPIQEMPSYCKKAMVIKTL